MWLLLFLVCCWTGAVSAQTIGTVTCPSGAGNVFNVPADGSLNTLYNTHGDGKTYNIAADTYTLSATIGPISSGTTCFVGVGSGQVTLTFTTGRHFQSDTTGTSLGLKGLTLRGGAGTGSGNSGGVTANQPEAVGVEDVVFDRCQSDFGGGLYVEADASVTESVVISNSAFVGNKAAGGSGGGLFLNSGDTAPTHQVTLSQVTFTDNEASDLGGGLYCKACKLSITGDSTLTNNLAVIGGGFFYTYCDVTVSGPSVWTGNKGHTKPNDPGVYGRAGAGWIETTTATFTGPVAATGNNATKICGALAVSAGSSTAVTITGSSTWTNNAAEENAGGAICVLAGATLTLRGDVLAEGNTAATAGGAAYVETSTLEITGSLCAQDNTAAQEGGAIAVTQGGTLTVGAASVQLAGNTPDGVSIDGTSSATCDGQAAVSGPGSFDVTGELCPCLDGGRCSCASGFVWAVDQCRCVPGLLPKCNVNDACCTAQGIPAPNTTACSARTVCQEDAMCNGLSGECPVINKPDHISCPWHPKQRGSDGYGYTQDQAQQGLLQGGNKVPAHEAAAWLTGTPQYDTQWPPCEQLGKCLDGFCALRFDHPACCFVAHDEDYKGYKDGRFDPYGAALQQGDSANKEAHTSSFGYWRSRDWYCWR